ncbi:MAG: MFS transporter, partial [Conexivisphaera sp.]
LAFLPFIAAGTALMGAADSLWTASIFFGIAGLGASVGWTPLAIWIQRAYERRRGTYLGVLQVGVNAGFGILGLMMPHMLSTIGWRGVWEVLGLASAAWLVPAAWLAKSSTSPPARIHFNNYLKEFTYVLRDGAFWLGGGSYMTAAFAIMTPLTFSADYAEYLRIGGVWGSGLFTVIGFVAMVGIAIP